MSGSNDESATLKSTRQAMPYLFVRNGPEFLLKRRLTVVNYLGHAGPHLLIPHRQAIRPT